MPCGHIVDRSGTYCWRFARYRCNRMVWSATAMSTEPSYLTGALRVTDIIAWSGRATTAMSTEPPYLVGALRVRDIDTWTGLTMAARPSLIYRRRVLFGKADNHNNCRIMAQALKFTLPRPQVRINPHSRSASHSPPRLNFTESSTQSILSQEVSSIF